MKTNTIIKDSFTFIVFISFALLFSSCYTVLKQSGEYHSEFAQEPADKPNEADIDSSRLDSSVAEEENALDSDETAEAVVINRYYYDSPWWAGYGYWYPGRHWSVSVGYSWYPSVYYPYDYYYWGGCYYPSYPGYYPYDPLPWYYPGTSYTSYSSRRNYGARHEALFGSGLNRMQSINSTTVISQRRYNTGTTATSNSTTITQNKKEVKATKKNRRRFNTKSITTSSKPVEKKVVSKRGNSGQRTYREVDIPQKNNRSFQQGFESAKNHFSRNDYQSSRSFNSSVSSDRSSSSRSSDGRSASPNVNSRTYNSKK